ncbi:MAG: ribosomal RNA small subunit methyltransferase A [Bdellovibrionales bacterium RIFOXYB1_FULL_37_110]|nr:MAG: ribosomal RNA small subunit methyltransferase A [Bdellovibrionales bacterium RIFOXYA1_FULL_38_20]OFZ45466.1 MAG: ribosomal RNA small subunit methyltransferase A [Bdellovibrionales bacterium RIFOXYC1_FULL_37_79]OFZ55090.1 MAG: ribosomal RNA small subunit methyltransferase A [Bdellovibrionales bacterium RIFOXYB2_FULL_36_6]OFZ61020.1 MAG: ribosomal RNA small subunit methyltransferase A [Bdellovibrionales bacterium RIFOXYB1_FULL_37_110]OFZ63471.1 MAG: ribosomal RNA small subunit methyltrans
MNKITANKKLGQHFLNNKHVAEVMTKDFADVAEGIIEIGPGKGVLTKYLVQWQIPFHIIEKDDRMIEPLSEFLDYTQITCQDALKVDLPELIKTLGWEGKKIWVISNLPYNVSVLILLQLIKTDSIKYMTLMFQKEVAEKIFNFTNLKNPMSSLMGICLNYFDLKLLCKVHPGSFNPPPKVESAVISFKRFDHPEVALKEFDSLEQFLRRLFQFKRKQMGGILKKYYPLDILIDTFKIIDKELTARAESLAFKELICLYKNLKKIS